jgi:hypothetical protein
MTNKGRTLTGAPYQSTSGPTGRWDHLWELPEGPTQIHFNHSVEGIGKIAISRELTIDGGDLPPFPEPFSSFPGDGWDGNCFYSVASLLNVEEVTACRVELPDRSPITGLLLQYSNGDKERLGEFRLDRAGLALRVGGSEGLFLGIARPEGQVPYLARIEFEPPQDMESIAWLKLPWDGNLEWWFGPGVSSIEHDSGAATSTLGS